MRNSFIASAITDILLNSASCTSSGTVYLVLPRSPNKSLTPVQPSACIKNAFPKTPDQRQKLLNAVRANLSTFVGEVGPGVVSLVYSVILTKGVEALADDMDYDGIVLINEYGYASQELINTMLVGKAATNVHDGDKDLGDNYMLKGIQR